MCHLVRRLSLQDAIKRLLTPPLRHPLVCN